MSGSRFLVKTSRVARKKEASSDNCDAIGFIPTIDRSGMRPADATVTAFLPRQNLRLHGLDGNREFLSPRMVVAQAGNKHSMAPFGKRIAEVLLVQEHNAQSHTSCGLGRSTEARPPVASFRYYRREQSADTLQTAFAPPTSTSSSAQTQVLSGSSIRGPDLIQARRRQDLKLQNLGIVRFIPPHACGGLSIADGA